jgi:signal peptidase I
MNPALKRGDRVLGEGITYLFRDPRPGEVVRYDPPSYKIEIYGGEFGESTTFVVNPRNGWERVMALPGETLECRDDVFYVNGRRLSEAWYPLLTGKMPPNFKIECPDGKFVVLISAAAAETGFPFNRAAPSLRDGSVTLSGWEEACLASRKTTEAGDTRNTLFDRAIAIYHPSPRRRFLTARGPRFADEAESLSPAEAPDGASQKNISENP